MPFTQKKEKENNFYTNLWSIVIECYIRSVYSMLPCIQTDDMNWLQFGLLSILIKAIKSNHIGNCGMENIKMRNYNTSNTNGKQSET